MLWIGYSPPTTIGTTGYLDASHPRPQSLKPPYKQPPSHSSSSSTGGECLAQTTFAQKTVSIVPSTDRHAITTNLAPRFISRSFKLKAGYDGFDG